MDLTLPDLRRLSRAFRMIENDAVPRVFAKFTWRRWRYDELADLYGPEVEWRPGGKIRVALIGGSGRAWLRQHHRMWWTTDPKKAGILFTADPLTGMEWDRARIAHRTHRDAEYLQAASRAAQEMQPIFKTHFQRIHREASGLGQRADALLSLRPPVVRRAEDAANARP